MIVTTTNTIEGAEIGKYLGIVFGDAVMGTNVFRDLFANITDIVGGRSASYEDELAKAKEIALSALVADAESIGADAVVAIALDYEVIGGDRRTLLMVNANGTAVKLK